MRFLCSSQSSDPALVAILTHITNNNLPTFLLVFVFHPASYASYICSIHFVYFHQGASFCDQYVDLTLSACCRDLHSSASQRTTIGTSDSASSFILPSSLSLYVYTLSVIPSGNFLLCDYYVRFSAQGMLS